MVWMSACDLQPYCEGVEINLGCPQRHARVGTFGAYLLAREHWETVFAMVPSYLFVHVYVMCVYVYVCVCVCMCMYICVWMYIYICVYVRMYVCVCVCVCGYVYVYAYIYTVCVWMCMCMCICMCMCMHMCKYLPEFGLCVGDVLCSMYCTAVYVYTV